MPLPTPEKGEDKQKFVQRCIEFAMKEDPQHEKHSHTQMIAMCMNQAGLKTQQRHLQLHVHLATKELGNAMIIEGTLLKPGVFVGLDGVPTKYANKFMKRVRANLIGKPIKFAHEISPSSMLSSIPQGTTVGFWTGVDQKDEIKVRGYVFQPDALQYLREHPMLGLSMEGEVLTEYGTSGLEEATDGELTGGVLIDDPACPTCKVEFHREVNLQGANTGAREAKEERVENTMSGNNNAAMDVIEFKKDLATKPTREDFFSWLEAQMKQAGIPTNIIPKAMGVLRKAVKVPYPYPSPKAQELVEGEFGPEAWKMLSAYTDFVGKCMKEGKPLEECARLFKEQKQPAEEGKEMGKKPGEGVLPADLAAQLAEMKTELEANKRAEALQLDQDITALTTEIKSYDKDFDHVKLLEGITCKHLQKKVLQKYVEVMKKHLRPIKMQVGQEKAKETVNAAVEEMLGTGVTFESLFGIEPKEE